MSGRPTDGRARPVPTERPSQDLADMRRRALLLLACPRSGATALAAALVRAGAHAGRTFLSVAGGDPPGLWQTAAMAGLNDRLLAALGMRWDALIPLPERWRERSGVRALASEADALIAHEFGGAEHVVVHEARLALTSAFWRERFEAADFDVGCALVVRRPAAVAASMARRDPFAPEKSLALWLMHLLEAERASRGAPRALVAYDRLVEAPATALTQVVAGTRFGLRVDDQGRDASLTAVRRDLRHFDGTADLATARLSSGIDRVLDEGYRHLASLAPTADLRRPIEAMAEAAQQALRQAIPPWLAHELGNARTHAEQQADALRESGAQVARLEGLLTQSRQAEAMRDEREARLRKRIVDLEKPRVAEDLNERVDEALKEIKQDMARVNATLADQRERERVLVVENAQLQRDLVDERNTIAQLSEAFEAERRTAEQLAAQLADTQAHLQAFAAEIDRARAIEQAWNEQIASLGRELEDLREALRAAQLERDRARKDRDDTSRRVDKLRAELDAARADLRIVDNDRTALAARAQAVGDAAQGLRDELARRAAAEAAQAAERERLGDEARRQMARAEALELELDRRMSDLTTLSGRHESLGKTLAAVEKSWMGRRALAGLRRNGRS